MPNKQNTNMNSNELFSNNSKNIFQDKLLFSNCMDSKIKNDLISYDNPLTPNLNNDSLYQLRGPDSNCNLFSQGNTNFFFSFPGYNLTKNQIKRTNNFDFSDLNSDNQSVDYLGQKRFNNTPFFSPPFFPAFSKDHDSPIVKLNSINDKNFSFQNSFDFSKMNKLFSTNEQSDNFNVFNMYTPNQ